MVNKEKEEISANDKREARKLEKEKKREEREREKKQLRRGKRRLQRTQWMREYYQLV